MHGESLGCNVNVRIKEIDRITGEVTNCISGHNMITQTGLELMGDYLSAYFSSGEIFNKSQSELENSSLTPNADLLKYVKYFKDIVNALPYAVQIGTDGTLEYFRDKGVHNGIKDPVTGDIITFYLSQGSSTMQSSISGSLISTNGFENGITISYGFLSSPNSFKNFKTSSSQEGIIVDGNNNTILIRELALMTRDCDKCWARISLVRHSNPWSTSGPTNNQSIGLVLNKNRIYDIVWNINLVSMNTQYVETIS